MTGAEERGRELAERVRSGDRRGLARLLTEVENRTRVAEAALRVLYPLAGQAHLVGVTGAPGAGKSTLVAALVRAVRATGRAAAVLAIDPSSPISGGAILGDRVRMQEHAGDREVFIRSMASRGHSGGLAAAAADASAALDAAGFPFVFLETVGAGQSEVEVASIADTTVVVEAPEMGDEVQAIKAGLLEVADLVVVTKGDRPGAQRTAAQMRAMLSIGASDDDAMTAGHHAPAPGPAATAAEPGMSDATLAMAAAERPAPDGARALPPDGSDAGPAGPASGAAPTGRTWSHGRHRPKRPQVLLVTAPTGEGIAELVEALDHRLAARTSGALESARLARAAAQLDGILTERLRALLHDPRLGLEVDRLVQAVAGHDLDPYEAADRIMERVAPGA